jgi:peptidoglycan-associated lipoprotein
MSKGVKAFAVSLAVIAIGFFGMACPKKPAPKTVPVTQTTATVTPPTVTIPPHEEPRVEPPHDFVQEKPQVEDLPANLEELNRMVQQRGDIQDAFFAYDESTLSSEAQAALTGSASWLRKHPEYSLLVEGHCDERGTEQYNLALGDRRANTAKEFLVTLGLDGNRIRTVSYGEERPFDSGHDEAAWAKNRRAHLVLVR